MTHASRPERPPITTRVVGLLRSATLIARVRDAIGPGGHLVVEADLRSCLKTLGERRHDAVIVQIDVDQSLVDNSAIVRLRAEYPRLPSLGYLASCGSPTALVADAVRAGASSVIIRDRDDTPHVLGQTLRQLARQPLATRIYTAFAAVVAPSCHPVLRYAVDHITERRSVDEVARDMGVDRKTPGNWLRKAGHPPLSDVLSWLRIAAAVELLSESTRDAASIAKELGFSSGPALRAALDRRLGATTEEARLVTLDDVLARFRAASKRKATPRISPIEERRADRPRPGDDTSAAKD